MTYASIITKKSVTMQALPNKNVILLLPSPDPEESIAILNEREPWLMEMNPNINEHFIRHNSNYELATHIVYTNDKAPQEVCMETTHRIQ
jgi:hypothetical protein